MKATLTPQDTLPQRGQSSLDFRRFCLCQASRGNLLPLSRFPLAVDGKRAAAFLGLLLATACAARADNKFWAVSTGTWSNSANWSPAGLPTSNDNAFIDNGGTATLGAGVSGVAMQTIVANNGSGFLNISGGFLSDFNGFIADRSGSVGTATITSGTWQNTGGMYVGRGGTGVLNINGGLVTSLLGQIGYNSGGQGTVNVTSGTWQNSQDITLGGVDLSNTGILNISGGLVSSRATILGPSNGPSAPGFGSSTLTLSGSAGGRGVLQTGQVIKNLNFGTSSLVFDGGILRATGNQSEFISGLSFPASGSVTINAGGAFIDSNGFSIGATSAMGGTGGLTKIGAGTLTLSSTNTYTGVTTVDAGILAFSGNGSVYSNGAAAGSVVVNNGGTLLFARNDTFGNASSAPATTVTVNAGGLVTGTNSFTTLNNLTLDGGELRADQGANASFPSFQLKGTVTATGTGSKITTAGSLNSQIQIGNNSAGGATTFDVSTSLTVSAVLQDGRDGSSNAVASGLVKTGTGVLTLSGNNTYSGSTTINSGTLQLGNSGNNLLNTGAVVLNGGVFALGANETIGSLSGTAGTVNVGSYFLTIGEHQVPTTFAGAITGAGGSVAKHGTSSLALTGSNSYTDRTSLFAGTLVAGNDYALGSGRIVLNGGVLAAGNLATPTDLRTLANPVNLNGDAQIGGSGRLVFTGSWTIGNGTRTLNVTNSADTTISGIIGDGGHGYGFVKSGTGTLTLSGNNTFSGGATITGGTLVAAHNNAAGTGTVTLDDGAVFLVESGIDVSNAIVLTGGTYARKLGAGSSLAGSMNAASGFAGGKPDTAAALLAGVTSGAATLQSSFSESSGALNDGARRSDIYSLGGVPIIDSQTGETDLFVLELSFTSTEPGSYLAWLDTGSNTWVNAINGNFGNNSAFTGAPFAGSFASFQSIYGTDLGDYVGAWGVSQSGGVTSSWAVLNHNSDFAVVPEPGTVALLVLGVLVVLRRK